MKKLTVFLLLAALLLTLTACGSKEEPVVEATEVPVKITSIPATPLPMDYDSQADEVDEPDAYEEQDVADDMPVDEDAEPEAVEQTPPETLDAIPSGETSNTQSFVADESDTGSVKVPFASPTPQPNAHVTRFAEISGTGLGFKFNYPADWTNVPGRSTVCFMQPIGDGTVYPARVTMTLKKMSHDCGPKTTQEEIISFLKLIRSKYDSKTFKVSDTLDTTTKFMGKKGFSTTYLAYDGEQEIKGYVIMTYFERYIYCYHFVCAYHDYLSLETAMQYMRDSVTVVEEKG